MLNLFKRCYNATYTHTRKSGDYAVEVEGDTLYLLFECSDGFWDWFHNFLFPAKPYKSMDKIWFCHRGFLKVWKAMRDEIEFTVNRMLGFEPGIKNIVCVGYSHGGPLALFATEDMEYLYGDKLNISGYGFGSPRVIWGFLPKAVKNRLKNYHVVRNIPDIVTHVPPVLFGFRHIRKPIKIGKHFKYLPIRAHYPEIYEEELRKVSEKYE